MVNKIKWSECCRYEMKFDRCLKCKKIAKPMDDLLIEKEKEERKKNGINK